MKHLLDFVRMKWPDDFDERFFLLRQRHDNTLRRLADRLMEPQHLMLMSIRVALLWLD
jgi:hypothetical protein